VILRGNKISTDVDEMLNNWFNDSTQPLERWQHILADFKIGKTHEFAKFSVALRELMLLSLHCDPVK
jgi:glutamate dehydrogenase